MAIALTGESWKNLLAAPRGEATEVPQHETQPRKAGSSGGKTDIAIGGCGGGGILDSGRGRIGEGTAGVFSPYTRRHEFGLVGGWSPLGTHVGRGDRAGIGICLWPHVPVQLLRRLSLPAREYVPYGQNDPFPFHGRAYGHPYDRYSWTTMTGYNDLLSRYYYPPLR